MNDVPVVVLFISRPPAVAQRDERWLQGHAVRVLLNAEGHIVNAIQQRAHAVHEIRRDQIVVVDERHVLTLGLIEQSLAVRAQREAWIGCPHQDLHVWMSGDLRDKAGSQAGHGVPALRHRQDQN